MPYTNGDLVNSMLPSMDQVSRYLRLANSANENSFSQRDVRPLMTFLQRLGEIDLYLMGLIQTRKLAIESFHYDIRLPLEYKITPTEEKQLLETKRRFRRGKIASLFSTMMDGILYSQSAVQLTWDNTRFGTMVTKREIYDLSDLDFSDETDGLVEYTGTGLNKSELDPDIHIITRHNPMENRKNFVGSFMRSAMLLSYLKYQTRWDWRDLNRRHGVPGTYGQYPEHWDYNNPEDKKKIDAFLAMVEKLKNDSAAVFPESVKILLEKAVINDSKQSFNEFISAANLELAILLHGQNLTSEISKGGSYAAAKVQDRVDDLIIEADLKKIEAITSEQYLAKDYLLNYGEPRNDYFELVFLRDEQEDYESNSRIISNIYSDPELRKNLPLKKDDVYKKLGLAKPADGDEIL
jgi:phage gp29-like protein